MYFDPRSYFYPTDVRYKMNCDAFLRTGILLDAEPLYLLIVGYYDKENNTDYLNKIGFGNADFARITNIFNGWNTFSFHITPHVFTKFIHLLWDHIHDPAVFHGIINVFLTNFEYINEKYTHKNNIMELEAFKNKNYDVNNASLIMTSEEHTHRAIITCKDKLSRLCQDKENILVVDYNAIKAVLQGLPSM